jgi:hypothetical protein
MGHGVVFGQWWVILSKIFQGWPILFGSEWFKDSSRFFLTNPLQSWSFQDRKISSKSDGRDVTLRRSQPLVIVLEASYNPFVSLFQHSKFKGRRNLHWNLGVYLTQNECCGKKNGKKVGETLWNCAVYDLTLSDSVLSCRGGINSQERGPDTPKQRKRTDITVSAAPFQLPVSSLRLHDPNPTRVFDPCGGFDKCVMVLKRDKFYKHELL